MGTAVINVSGLSPWFFFFFVFSFLLFFFFSFSPLKRDILPLWVISMCAPHTKGKKKSLQFGPPFTHTNFLQPMPCLARTSTSHRVSHLHSSPFPTNKAGCSDAAGEWPTCSYTDREATHSSGSRRPPWKPSTPTRLNSNLICSGYILKTITQCHRCFLAMWWGISVTPGNASRGVIRRGK